MTNILQMQEILKSVPDQRLMQEMQQPTGRAPQYLVMTEIQRRKKVRDEYQGQVQDQQTTVAEDMVMGPAPQQPPMAPAGMPPQMSQGMPPQMQQPMPAAQPPMNMEGGGALYRQAGSQASQYFGAVDLSRLVSLVEAEAGNQDDAGKRAVAAVILNRTLSDQFPDTIEAVAEQRTPGGSYQFSPLINTRGDVDQLPAGSAGTRAAVLDLLADFDNKNPVGDALYFQNPEISGMIFPALRGNYDDGKRNNEPFPDGVTKIGDHVFSDRYGNEETAFLEPVAFRVEDNALTDIDKKRLGTEEAMKITGAGEEVIMAESEPPPVPPSAFRGGIAGIPEKIAERTGGFRGPTFAETLQQAPLPQEQLVGGLDAYVPPPAQLALKPREQVIAETLAGLQSPDASQPVELYDAAALAGSGEPAPVDPVAARLRPLMGAGTQPVDTMQAITSGVMPQLAEVRDANLSGPSVASRLMSSVENPFGRSGPDTRSLATLRRKERRSGAAPDSLAKLREFASNTVDFLRSGAPSPPMSAQPDYSLDVAGYDPAAISPPAVAAAAPDPNVDSTEFARLGRETAPIDPIQAQSAGANMPSAAAMKAAYLEQTRPKAPAGQMVEGEDTDLDGVTEAASAASGTGTPTAAPTGGMADLLAQIQAGRDDAKAMGLLTAGLGIMQQASQPGATLLSSIPGAAAGVKQYSADRANLAKQQLALATLANQQEATRIAAERAAKPGDYERFERDTLADLRKSPDKSKYFYPNGDLKPNVRADIRARWNKLTNPYAAQKSLMSGFTDWVSSNAGIKARTSDKYKALKTEAERKAYLAQQYAEDYKRITGALGTNTGTRTNPLSAYETK